MAILCEDLNLLYLCTAKTGSTSVSDTLLDQLGGRWFPTDHIWDGDDIAVDYKHSSLAELVAHGLLTDDRLASLNIALTVRNPYSWVLSGYRWRVSCYQTYLELGEASPEWIRTRLWDIEPAATNSFADYVEHAVLPQVFTFRQRYVDGYDGGSNLTYLRIEHIDAELNAYLSGLGVGWTIDFPHVNRTRGANYRESYDDRAKALVTEAFSDDLERFGYEF